MKRIFLFIFIVSVLVGCNTSKRGNKSESFNLDTVNSTEQLMYDVQSSAAEDYAPYVSKTKPALRSARDENKPPVKTMMRPDETPAMKDGIISPSVVLSVNERSLTSPNPVSDPTIINREIGRLVYDIPDTMKMGKMVVVRIRINRDTSDRTISIGINGVDTVIRVTQTMDVSIIDPTANSFIIQKNNGDEQLIESHEYSEWVFNITPLRSGTNKLNLVISIIIDGKKKEQVYSDVVFVKISTRIVVKTWWEKYWEWIFSTLLIPFSIWLYGKRKKKKKKSASI